MDDSGILLLLLFALFVAWPWAHVRGKRWAKEHPEKRTYAWGYFQSITSMACVLVAIGALSLGSVEGGIISVWMGGVGLCGYYMWHRKRWAWITGIVLSLNPWLWIINGIYLKNRWHEMAADGLTGAGENGEQMLYLFDDGKESGPFTLVKLRQMQGLGMVSETAYVCRDGDPEWTPLAEMTVSTAKAIPASGGWLKLRLTNLQQAFQPSQNMNYRVFIPCVVLAMVLGALLHSWLGERYRFQAMGNGHMMKTDRWTGEAWTTFTASGEWRPVQPSKSGPNWRSLMP